MYLVFNLYLGNGLSLSKVSHSLVYRGGWREGSSECGGKGVWREEYVTSLLLPNQLGAGGVALHASKALSTQTGPQQSRCRSQVHAVFLQGTVL